MSAEWYCRIGEKTVGPLSAQQLRTIVARGQLRPEHMVRQGNSPWIPAGRVKGLFPETPAAPARPAQAPARPAQPPAGATAKSAPLPTAHQSPQPPADIPEEFTLGSAGHKKHHVTMNVDKLQIDAVPVKVTGRKTKGVPGLKKSQQKQLQMILLGIIGGGLLIALVAFIIAYSQGKLSAPEPEKKEVAKAAEPKVEEKAAETKKEEKKPEETDDSANWKEMNKSIPVGGLEVKVMQALRQPPPKNAKVDPADYAEVLIVPTKVTVKLGSTKEVECKGWASGGVRKNVTLKDDAKTKYELLDVVEPEGAKTVGPGKPLQFQLIFEPPKKEIKHLLLQLPANGVGGTGMIPTIQIPAQKIEQAGAAPADEAGKEKKAPASAGDEPAAKPAAKKEPGK